MKNKVDTVEYIERAIFDREYPPSLFRGRSKLKLLYQGYLIFISMIIIPGPFKNWILRRAGVKVHRSAFISPLVKLDPIHPELIHIDEGAFIGIGARIFTHIIEPYDEDLMIMKVQRIHLKKKSFIGGYSTIRCGVTIGERGMVASDSLVTRSVDDDTMVLGVPAKVVRKDE